MMLAVLPACGAISFAWETPGNPLFTIGLYTSWQQSFGRDISRQNVYNPHIKNALQVWPSLDPLILKSLLVQESGLKNNNRRRHYKGIAQIGRKEARLAGLKTRGKDERLDPDKAIPACVKILKLKAESLNQKVFAVYGKPQGDEYWKFIAAAYNGGDALIAKAIRLAYANSKPEKLKFDKLLESADGNIQNSPLYQAIPRHWGKKRKFEEISRFSIDVVNRARQ